MPPTLTRIRIAGFKSFAEPAVMEIRPGLTGIVGPNGCGKSNVVEALRWAMGESSARSLRGDDMDDVIFAGTARRPGRSLAEVVLTLEGTEGLAPAPLHTAPDLEVSRRIERGNGSVFRLNGRETRARDVQTLFADLASGARSSAMVSQGRVGALVQARPDERRAILEEAAGISGLHARRHEAELKLRAAEANLARAEETRARLLTQLEALHRQAEQATRYRTVSQAIRATEAEFFAIQRARSTTVRARAHGAVQEAGLAVAASAQAVVGATTRATQAVAALPGPREAAAAARAGLERHRMAVEQVTAEAARAAQAARALAARREELARDLVHAEAALTEAALARARLMDEQSALEGAARERPDATARARQAADHAAAALHVAEAAAEAASRDAAEHAAQDRASAEALALAGRQVARIQEATGRLDHDRARAAADMVAPDALDLAAQTVAAAEREGEVAAAALAAAETARAEAVERGALLRETARQTDETERATANEATEAARTAAKSARAERDRLAAEMEVLTATLASGAEASGATVGDALTVPAGLEVAVGAALGDTLAACLDLDAPVSWRDLPPLPPSSLAEPLASLIAAPAALARALSRIGVADDGADRQAALVPGETLVSRDGTVWRWDGLVRRAGGPDAQALRLRQRNRLHALTAALTEVEPRACGAEAALAAAAAEEIRVIQAGETAERAARASAETAERDAGATERAARERRRAADQALAAARAELARLSLAAAAATQASAGLDERAARLAAEQAEAADALARAEAVRAALSDAASLRTRSEAARRALSDARMQDTAAREALRMLSIRSAAEIARLASLQLELTEWLSRGEGAGTRLTDLRLRRDNAEAEHQATPTQDFEAMRRAALDALEHAEAVFRDHADALAAAEHEHAEATRAARAAELEQGTARENLVRAEADAAQADHAWGTVEERIIERLGANPALPDPPAETEGAEDRTRRRLERLLREREDIGPVNLRAEHDALAVQAQADGIAREQAELGEAIAKLRGSVGHLNREGRERLGASFARIDDAFQTLFGRMFGGGRAHLALVGSDDPLLAGLEIYAQPPGKKLSALSLLSGGEQALTALCLIFAVFRCNPAPVCVLDEVDAPLDDANVGRFCALVEDIARETATRFLVVTHHPLTMARMDRLYGVTMQERGVSRLLSVDLSAATEAVQIAAE